MNTTRLTPRRIGLIVLAVLALFWVLGTLVFTVTDLVTQLSSGTIRTRLYLRPGMFGFTDTGDHGGAPVVSNYGGLSDVTVAGLTGGTLVLHIVVVVVGMLSQVALGIVAFRLLKRMVRDAPFAGPLAREARIAAAAVLVIAIAGAGLGWVERSVIGGESGSYLFDSVFAVDPLLITVGLVLLLVASVFRTGERLQRETEGLV